MPSVLNAPIKHLDAKTASGLVLAAPVRIVSMDHELIDLWSTRVQPLIDANYMHATANAPARQTRADVGWQWPVIHRFAAYHNWATIFPGNKSGGAIAMCIVLPCEGGPDFPIGMLTAVPELHCDVFGNRRHRGFAWYLSDAPIQVYSELLKVSVVRGVAQALVDCSIQAALDRGHDGSHLLRADPKGGGKLISFYQQDCVMDRVPLQNHPVTPFWRRSHSDEYFHFDASQASGYCSQFDWRRV